MNTKTKTLILTREKIYSGNLILVNREHGYRGKPEDLLIPAQDCAPGILLNRCAATLLTRLMEEIDGWRHIVPVSGWRSREEQQAIWDESIKDNGEEFTRKFVALPGHSEHQTGLAIDLGLRREHVDFLCPEFPYTGICQIFRENAARYGFILRYPRGRQETTGIGHEPWHFRYVGVPHAQIMADNGLCLEEYSDFLRDRFTPDKPCRLTVGSRTVRVSYVKAQGAETRLQVPAAPALTVSGDNADGFILTEWRKHDENQRELRMA